MSQKIGQLTKGGNIELKKNLEYLYPHQLEPLPDSITRLLDSQLLTLALLLYDQKIVSGTWSAKTVGYIITSRI